MDELTPTHQIILRRYADGAERKQIARELGLKDSQVQRLTREACSILGARNRTHAVAVAWRARLIL